MDCLAESRSNTSPDRGGHSIFHLKEWPFRTSTLRSEGAQPQANFEKMIVPMSVAPEMFQTYLVTCETGT